MNDIELPPLVRQTALAQGDTGARWVRDLPEVIAQLARQWSLTIGDTLAGGTASYVGAATTAGGHSVVLKVAMPLAIDGEDDRFAQTLAALELADGRGCVRLLEHDAERSAMLFERLGRNLDSLGLPLSRQLEIICDTVRQLWVPVPEGTALPTGAEKADWLAEFIPTTWESLGRPCSAAAVEHAVGCAVERRAAFDRRSAVLVHGDAHMWNTLEAGDGTFKLIDPEGLVSEPAHDLAIPMRERSDALLAGDTMRLGRERAALLSTLTGVDETAIWQWGFIERVSTGLYAMSLGHDGAADFLAVADRFVA
jgi:streptomycin 6-kinase